MVHFRITCVASSQRCDCLKSSKKTRHCAHAGVTVTLYSLHLSHLPISWARQRELFFLNGCWPLQHFVLKAYHCVTKEKHNTTWRHAQRILRPAVGKRTYTRKVHIYVWVYIYVYIYTLCAFGGCAITRARAQRPCLQWLPESAWTMARKKNRTSMPTHLGTKPLYKQ